MNLISDYTFSFDRNSIGWDWKEYDSAQDLYIVDSPVYVIKTSDNDYYKLFTTIIATGFFIFFKRYVYIAR